MSATYADRARRIADKLALVRARFESGRLPLSHVDHREAKQHGFRLNPPLTEPEVARFEAAHGITLPPCYRTFLLMLGNGGAGPYYGVYKLEKWDEVADFVVVFRRLMDKLPADFLARPSPFKPGRNPHICPEDDPDDMAQWLAMCQGCIAIGSMGCAYSMQLIVSGPGRGRVAYVDGDGQSPHCGWDADFLSWYERWVDEFCGGNQDFGFSWGLAGREADMFALVDDPGTDEELAEAAVANLRRLSSVSADGAAKVATLLSHRYPLVRAAACNAILSLKLDAHRDLVPALLEDPAPVVREAAIAALLKIDATRWSGRLHDRLFRETDSNVAAQLLADLARLDRITEADRRHLLVHAPFDWLRAWTAGKLTWSRDDTPLAVALLDDASAKVRAAAVTVLAGLGSSDAITALIDRLTREPDPAVIDAIRRVLGERAAAMPLDGRREG